MQPDRHVVRPASDWEVPEPWEVVRIGEDGTEAVVDRTPTLDGAEAKARDKGTSTIADVAPDVRATGSRRPRRA